MKKLVIAVILLIVGESLKGQDEKKYLWVTVTAYNRVNDVIGTKTVQLIGPIDPGDAATGSFDDVMYSKVFHSGKIVRVKIQFMDGAIKEYSGKALHTILL